MPDRPSPVSDDEFAENGADGQLPGLGYELDLFGRGGGGDAVGLGFGLFQALYGDHTILDGGHDLGGWRRALEWSLNVWGHGGDALDVAQSFNYLDDYDRVDQGDLDVPAGILDPKEAAVAQVPSLPTVSSRAPPALLFLGSLGFLLWLKSNSVSCIDSA